MENILYLHAGAEMYGADKILLELVTSIDKTKFNPIVVLPNEGILKECLEKKGIETYVVNYPILRRKYFNPKGILNYTLSYKNTCREIIKLLKSKGINIDIIHVNTTAVLEGIYLKKKLKAKLLWHVHEIIQKPKIINKFLSYCIGKYADSCIVVSNAVKNHLLESKLVSKEKIKVIYNGIDADKFNPSVDSSYLYDEWNIPRDAIKVGMIGRVNSWKGQNDFLDATVPLLKEYKNLYLFIVGSAFEGQEWRVQELKDRIIKEDNSNRIIFSEFRSDNFAVESFFDMLILPSTNPDPLPTVVLESMGCGKAVIGYKHGGITEMVKDGETGFLASPNTPHELSEKINLALKNKTYVKMGEKARDRLVEQFSMVSFIKNFEKEYAKI